MQRKSTRLAGYWLVSCAPTNKIPKVNPNDNVSKENERFFHDKYSFAM